MKRSDQFNALGMSYSDRIKAELNNFEAAITQEGLATSIPPIFTYWSTKFLSPRLLSVFGATGVPNFFASELKISAKSGGLLRILSLGSGDCRTEIEIARLLVEQNIQPLFICCELNELVVEKAKALIEEAGLTNAFEHFIGDVNVDFPSDQFDAAMANHSLHHFVGLEHIFGKVSAGLSEDGVFVINDMIGRNGHMRWPEALPFVEQIWNYLPLEKRFNSHAKCYEDWPFVNYDCTTGGDFEGVRAQDILPLLLKHFHFAKFVGFGNIPDVFVDRAYGQNFSPEDDADRRLIDYLDALNSHLIDTGIVKPTMMFATVKAHRCDCDYDRWTPHFSLRLP